MPDKIDFKKTLDGYRARRGVFRIVEIPDARYLSADGEGDPNTRAFGEAIEALYPVAYRLKAASRRLHARDYVVPPLEGLWWADDLASFTTARDKTQWRWSLLIRMPDWADDALLAAADPGPRVRVQSLAEGRCVQTLHVGAFDDEGAVLARMHEEFLPAEGLRPTGLHHEIYLSDFRRVPPERRRTILRQPVAPA